MAQYGTVNATVINPGAANLGYALANTNSCPFAFYYKIVLCLCVLFRDRPLQQAALPHLGGFQALRVGRRRPGGECAAAAGERILRAGRRLRCMRAPCQWERRSPSRAAAARRGASACTAAAFGSDCGYRIGHDGGDGLSYVNDKGP